MVLSLHLFNRTRSSFLFSNQSLVYVRLIHQRVDLDIKKTKLDLKTVFLKAHYGTNLRLFIKSTPYQRSFPNHNTCQLSQQPEIPLFFFFKGAQTRTVQQLASDSVIRGHVKNTQHFIQHTCTNAVNSNMHSNIQQFKKTYKSVRIAMDIILFELSHEITRDHKLQQSTLIDTQLQVKDIDFCLQNSTLHTHTPLVQAVDCYIFLFFDNKTPLMRNASSQETV